jgi:aminomethyltransferase
MTTRRSALYSVHEDAGAKFTDFGGWEMPVEFESIRSEHSAVRDATGLFDISHMGQIAVSGPDATALMQHLTTNDVTALSPGRAQYSMITDENGNIIDDTVVYRLPDWGEATFLFVPNAGNDHRLTERWRTYRDDEGYEATVENKTEDYAMVAFQGPDAQAHMLDDIGVDPGSKVRDLDRFESVAADVGAVNCLVSRTGYTGEDGFELVFPWEQAETVWEALEPHAQPCGLGARDTLRVEMGFLLGGHEFDPEENPRNPYEARTEWTVKLDTEFVGRDALERVDAEGPDERLTGFRLIDRGIPRQGYDVVNRSGSYLGTVTSGTMSPTLGEPIGMAYLPVEHRDEGTSLRVRVRGEPKKAQTQTLPFIDRA